MQLIRTFQSSVIVRQIRKGVLGPTVGRKEGGARLGNVGGNLAGPQVDSRTKGRIDNDFASRHDGILLTSSDCNYDDE
jgi:hypothetical protein